MAEDKSHHPLDRICDVERCFERAIIVFEKLKSEKVGSHYYDLEALLASIEDEASHKKAASFNGALYQLSLAYDLLCKLNVNDHKDKIVLCSVKRNLKALSTFLIKNGASPGSTYINIIPS